MKRKGILMSFYVFLLFTIMACNGQRNGTAQSNNVDSLFKHNYTVLDTISKKHFFDTSAACKDAITFMEKTTGINASKDGNYFGEILFTQKDLDKWKEWYDKNRK